MLALILRKSGTFPFLALATIELWGKSGVTLLVLPSHLQSPLTRTEIKALKLYQLSTTLTKHGI